MAVTGGEDALVWHRQMWKSLRNRPKTRSASSTCIARAAKLLAASGLDPGELAAVEKAVPHSVTTEMGMQLLNMARPLDAEGRQATADGAEMRAFWQGMASGTYRCAMANWSESTARPTESTCFVAVDRRICWGPLFSGTARVRIGAGLGWIRIFPLHFEDATRCIL